MVGYIIGNIAGPFKTVNRGELLAIATLVEAFGGKGEALTDSSFVAKGIYKMQRGLCGIESRQTYQQTGPSPRSSPMSQRPN